MVIKYKLNILQDKQPYLNGTGCLSCYETTPFRYMIWQHCVNEPDEFWLVEDWDGDRKPYTFETKRQVLVFINETP